MSTASDRATDRAAAGAATRSARAHRPRARPTASDHRVTVELGDLGCAATGAATRRGPRRLQRGDSASGRAPARRGSRSERERAQLGEHLGRTSGARERAWRGLDVAKSSTWPPPAAHATTGPKSGRRRRRRGSRHRRRHRLDDEARGHVAGARGSRPRSRARRASPRRVSEIQPHATDIGFVHEPGSDRLDRDGAPENFGGAAARAPASSRSATARADDARSSPARRRRDRGTATRRRRPAPRRRSRMPRRRRCLPNLGSGSWAARRQRAYPAAARARARPPRASRTPGRRCRRPALRARRRPGPSTRRRAACPLPWCTPVRRAASPRRRPAPASRAAG